MNKKVMVLLHGFKRNNEDDFGRVHHFFDQYRDEYDIKNVIWYDNYNKKTLTRKHLDFVLTQVAFDINNNDYEEIVIVAYSTGNVVAMYLMDKLSHKEKVRFFGTVPPFEIEKFKWIERLKDGHKYKKSLKKKLGVRRYRRIQKKLKQQQRTEKYPIQISNYIYYKIIRPDGYRIKEINDGYFLLALNDQVVNTKVSYRELTKNPENDITIADFRHDQLFKLNQEVFMDWFSEKFIP